jgi:hypothetical protein
MPRPLHHRDRIHVPWWPHPPDGRVTWVARTLDCMAGDTESHTRFADRVRERVSGDGLTDPDLRIGAMNRGGGGAAIAEPYDALAYQIGEAASRVTDAQVAAVRAAAGTDKGAFEIILSASIGAGLVRWDAALRVIEGAPDATP